MEIIDIERLLRFVDVEIKIERSTLNSYKTLPSALMLNSIEFYSTVRISLFNHPPDSGKSYQTGRIAYNLIKTLEPSERENIFALNIHERRAEKP